MTAPVTHGEQHEELAQCEASREQKRGHLAAKADLANVMTKADLDAWGQTLMADMDRVEEEWRRVLGKLLVLEAPAIHASATLPRSVSDENHADRPKRVSRLEARVLGPRRR